MMSLIEKVKLSFMLLLCVSCTKTLHQDDDLVRQLIDCQHESQCYLLVIPMAGFSGCVNTAVQFVQNSTDKKTTMHYIASTRNTKLAKIKLGNAFVHQNVIIDADELFYQEKNEDKYPILYQLENGNVLDKGVLESSTIQEVLSAIE